MFKRKEKNDNKVGLSPSLIPFTPTVSPINNADSKPTSATDQIKALEATILAENCVITGEIKAAGDIHIHGSFNGTVSSENTVVVQRNGKVEGEIHANRIEISGQFKGLCRGCEVAIKANGFVEGTIESEALGVDQLGHFYGQSKPFSPGKEQDKKGLRQKDKLLRDDVMRVPPDQTVADNGAVLSK